MHLVEEGHCRSVVERKKGERDIKIVQIFSPYTQTVDLTTFSKQSANDITF